MTRGSGFDDITFGLDVFIDDLTTLVGFRTEVCRNRTEFERANQWIRDFLGELAVEFVDFDCHGLTSTIIKPVGSERTRIIGDGHIEVVPGPDHLYRLRRAGDYLHGRGVADMKTQVLAMLYALRELARSGDHKDFWVVLGED